MDCLGKSRREIWLKRKFKVRVVARSLRMIPAQKGKVTA